MQSKNLNYFYITGIFLILILPILTWPPVLHPPAWAKELMFRMICSVLFFIFIWQTLFKNKEKVQYLTDNLKNKNSPLFLPIWILFALSGLMILANIFSVEPSFSFWSSPYRGGGTLNFLFLVSFCIFTFLTLKQKNWSNLWDVSLFVGILSCLIAFIQKFNLLGNYFVSYTDRPVSSFGGSIFFALYLVLLVFVAFSLGITSKKWKRYFYFGCTILFLFCIYLSATRAAMIGSVAGVLFFVFFYPLKRYYIKWAKILLLSGIILFILLIIFLKFQPQILDKILENRLVGDSFNRIWSITGNFSFNAISSSRASGWAVAIPGILEKPLLGWGPMNFSVPFDKYFNPNLPGINNDSGYWDRAHSFIFEYASTIGVPFLLAYLWFNWVIFSRLNKIKKSRPEVSIIIHGIQASLIAYLVTNLFSFDVFETYLIYFILIAYSLYIISFYNQDSVTNQIKNLLPEKKWWKEIFIFVLFVVLIWFLWSYNIKLFKINSSMNMAEFLSQKDTNQACQIALSIDESLTKRKSVLDNYVRLNYIDLIGRCNDFVDKEQKIKLYSRAMQILDELIKERPTYTRNFIFKGSYAYNLLISGEKFSEQERENLKNIAVSSLEKALQFSPNRPVIYVGLTEVYSALNDYDKAIEIADECIEVNHTSRDCRQRKAFIYLKQNKIDEATELIKEAYGNPALEGNAFAEKNLTELINGYSALVQSQNPKSLEYYQILVYLYQDLISRPGNYNKFQYHASLAFAYSKIEQYESARDEALIVKKLSPESAESVDAFLATLPK